MFDELARLRDVLEQVYAPQVRHIPYNALIVGAAGNAETIGMLCDLLPQACLTVIDRDEEALEAISGLSEQLRIIGGAAADLADLTREAYDLILIRHPDIVLARTAWEATLRACAAALRTGGLLIVTTELLADAAFIDGVLGVLALRLREGSPYTAVPVAPSGVDRYILIYE